MSDYNAVQKALSGGADPAMLCATCPWDRYCLTPPTMTRAEIDAYLEKAKADDERNMAKAQRNGENPGMPIGGLLTALTFGGRDTSAQICPVFAVRLKSSGGRRIADTLKAAMQGWDDQS